MPSVCWIWPGLLWQQDTGEMPFASAIQENQSCSQLLLLPSLLNAPESLRHITLAEILSGWSWGSNNTSQPHDMPMLSVAIEWYSSTLECFKSPFSISLFLRPAAPLLAFPRTPANRVHGAPGRSKEAASIKTGKIPAPLGLVFSSSTGNLGETKHHSSSLPMGDPDMELPLAQHPDLCKPGEREVLLQALFPNVYSKRKREGS